MILHLCVGRYWFHFARSMWSSVSYLSIQTVISRTDSWNIGNSGKRRYWLNRTASHCTDDKLKASSAAGSRRRIEQENICFTMSHEAQKKNVEYTTESWMRTVTQLRQLKRASGDDFVLGNYVISCICRDFKSLGSHIQSNWSVGIRHRERRICERSYLACGEDVSLSPFVASSKKLWRHVVLRDVNFLLRLVTDMNKDKLTIAHSSTIDLS